MEKSKRRVTDGSGDGERLKPIGDAGVPLNVVGIDGDRSSVESANNSTKKHVIKC